MPTVVSVSFDPAQMADLQATLSGMRNGFAIAMQAAISRTLTTYRARVARRIGEEVRLKIGDIKKQIQVKRPSLKDLTGKLSIVSDGKVYLIQFVGSGKQTTALKRFAVGGHGRTPLVVKVRKKGDLAKYPATIAKGFIAVMPGSTHPGVFQRTGEKRVMKKGRHQGHVREAIRRLRGPTALGVFQNAVGQDATTILAETVKGMEDTMYQNALSQTERLLAGKGLGGRLTRAEAL